MNEAEIYRINNITFILQPSKTIVYTKYQTFILVPARHNYKKKLERLRESIKRGEMQSLTDIVSYCNLKPGRRGQMAGIEMINTRLERHWLPGRVL